MAQPQLLQVKLSRFDAQPWGFRLQGGTDFAQPLLVQKVNAGSLSEQAGLQPGDAVVKINDVDVFNLRHKDAQDIVVRSGNNFVITVQRGGSTWRPHVTPTGNVPQPNSPYLQTVTKTSLAHKQQDSQHIGCGYNNAARPFSNGGDGGVKSIVNKQYNTPVGIYSDESIAETLSAQAEVLAGGVLGVNFKKNEKEYQGDRSEVLKFLREEETGQSTPAFGNSHYEHDAPQQLQQQQQQQQPQQQYNQHQHQQHYHQQQQQQSSTTRHVSAPVNSPKPPSTGGLPTGQNICTECERLITGVFVRIKDKNLHVECFKCATCGTSLKNQGYYNFNNKLYCDIHAKQAAINNPPSGTEGYVPVPIKPNTKLSASTISSALNSHGYGGSSNGYSNGNSAPAPAPVASSQAAVATVAPTAAAAAAAATPQAATATDSPAATASSTDNMSAYVADEPSSIYGQISADSVAIAPPPPQPPTAGGGDQPFEYVTLTGNVIRSVQAPGKGACPSYKVNQGYARPFGAAAPKSPVSYPPQQQQQQSPRPAPGGQNPYATLPRSNVGQQGGEAVEELQPEFEEEDCYEMDIEVALAASRQSQRGSSFTWPPPQDDSHLAPTAAPLYIPPPETQHVVVSNPVQEVPPLPPGGATARLDPQPQVGASANGAPQWQSYSAPQLTAGSARQLAEQESSSDSYTSTSTTTTTTSEEYQRMYAAQVQAYQMQEQSGSEFDYQVDYGSTQDSMQDYPSGRRSAQECVDSLAVPLSTYKLVDMVREVTPSPVTTPTQTPAPAAPSTRRVVFNDEPEIKELPQLPAELETIPEASEALEDREGLVIEQRCQILESERKFQPTPEIKIEIAPVRQIPPTKIPNPMPKEWINPMIRVLTTAPEVPFHLVECPFPRPCGDDFEAEAAAAEAAKAQEVPEAPPPPVFSAQPAINSVEPSPAPLRESPPRGSRLTQAMVTAPEFELKFAPPADQGIPLPEETEPYMPPPIDTKPYLREDYRPKSPFVSALTTAPDRPFEGHFDKDVPIHMIDLPTPKEHLSMCDALCTAPERGYTPLNPENAMHRVDEEQKQQELKKREFQVLDHEEELGIRPEPPQSVQFYETRRDQPRKSSAFAAMQAFQPSREPLSSNTVSNAGSVADTPRASIVSALKEETDLEYQKYLKAQQRNQKRLDYFHQKEEELSGLQGQQLTQLQRELSNQQQSLLSQQQLQQSKLLQLQQCVQSQELQQQMQQLAQKSQQQPPQANQQQQQQLGGSQQQQHSQVTQRTQQQQEHSLLSQTTFAETQNLQANAQSQSSASYSSKATACSNSSSTVPPATTSTAFAPAPAPAPASVPAPTSTPLRPSAIAVQSSYCSRQFDAHELIEETAEELEHSEVLFPPPSPLSHLTKQGKAVQSGLHKADSIPKYQRNWTVLPTQSPIRTPEPQELRENVPLAFVDAPKAPVTSDTSTVHRPIAQVAAPTTVVAPSREREKERRPQLSVPIIVEDRSGPVTMAFQPLDELVRPDQALTPTRPYTPSLTNKPAPIVPFYQTEEKLVFEECSATHARNYNELNASPFPDRTRSPAPGPPPNPLNAIRAPRMKEPETKSNILSVSGGPRLQTGSITTGQSYQGQLLAHSEQSSQSASQSFSQQPERITEQRLGNLSIQQREQSSQLQQQAQSQTQSQTRSQVGNTQIERRRKVTEEFERTQSAKTIEIRTGSQSVSQSRAQSQSISQAQTQAQSQSQNQSDTERRSSYGKTGFVASQAKRLSCMEEEISSLTSQSQAISARASALGEGCFPNLRSPTFDSKFPLKPAPAESIVPGYATVPAATKMLTAPPPGFLQQQQQQRSAFSGYQATTSSVQQSSFASSSKATTSSLSSSSASASASASASVARSSQSLTQASAITTTTNNQATTAYRSSNGSITQPNLASRPSIASITAPGSANAPAPAAAPAPLAAPTRATAPFKAPIVPKSVIANAVNAAAPPAPAVFPPDLSDLNLNSNVDNSPGAGGKSAGAFGATSAPKRGRGILNKAAGPGVRIPLCNSCNVQIRGPFITALGRIWCPDHFICVNGNCRRPLQDIGFVEEKGDLYCEYCFEKYLAPTCSKCAGKIKGDCLNAIGKHFHPECFTCGQCGKIFGNRPFFLEDGNAYCEADWNELFTTKCFACGFPVEAGDRWVEALNHNYHSQCFNCTFCKQNLEGQSFYNKGGRPFCKNHAR
ncbi:uncharacterized protein Dere_GG22334, isoform L [Drosophila erecta]|uniref:Uncharacterized protein, isoform D n=1 Tax=Drosophila erecta TaxID=7220 RepID=B3NQ92_DROER|nr:uncharacterized protein Dere_GG22334, isoform D [Drosophila erecta]KQS62518.1 uncharacterized protein Dere_GG22334, isoform L [Drosophila erecta]